MNKGDKPPTNWSKYDSKQMDFPGSGRWISQGQADVQKVK
jgi:hypothetical protein